MTNMNQSIYGFRHLSVFIGLLLYMPLATADSPKWISVMVTAQSINIRSEPSSHQPPIGQLRKGEKVKILTHVGDGKWLPVVRADGTTGFVFHRQLVFAQSDEARTLLFETEAQRRSRQRDTIQLNEGQEGLNRLLKEHESGVSGERG